MSRVHGSPRRQYPDTRTNAMDMSVDRYRVRAEGEESNTRGCLRPDARQSAQCLGHRNADALVIEATYIEQEHELAKSFQHLTAHQAATLALESGVQQLLDRKSTRLNSSHTDSSRMPSSA